MNRESRPPATGTDPSPAADEDGAPEAEVPRAAGRIGSRWTNERELADAIHGTVVGAAVMVAASLHGTPGQVVITVVATRCRPQGPSPRGHSAPSGPAGVPRGFSPDGWLQVVFSRQDTVEVARRVVDPILDDAVPVHP